ncbi:MAG: hypothetical protein WCY57_06015, partial [Micavibrio sp.]
MNALRAFKDDYVSFARRTDAAERKWDEDAVRFAAGEFIKLHENGLATDFETEGSVEEVVSYIAEQFNLRLADVESRVREHIAPLIDYTGETVGRSAGEKNVSQIYGRVAVTERPLTDLPEHEDFSLIAIDADGIHDDGASRR